MCLELQEWIATQPVVRRTKLGRADLALLERQHAGVLARTPHLILPLLDLDPAAFIQWKAPAFEKVRTPTVAHIVDDGGRASVNAENVGSVDRIRCNTVHFRQF